MRMPLTARLALLAGFPLAAMTVTAQEAEAPGVRFTLSTSEEGGFIRLDTLTGAVSHCYESGGRWRCEPAGEAPAPDAQAIARIEARLIEMKEEIAALTGLDGRLSAVESGQLRTAAESRALAGGVETLAEDIARLSDEMAAVREALAEPLEAAPAANRGFAAEAVSRLGRLVASLKRGAVR
jgi:hypothetical protein